MHLDNNVLSLVMSDPLDVETQSAIRLRTGYDLGVYIASETDINEQLEKLYGGEEEGSSEKLIETMTDVFADDENI